MNQIRGLQRDCGGGYRLQVTGCRLQVTGCKLQVARLTDGWELLSKRTLPVLCRQHVQASLRDANPFFRPSRALKRTATGTSSLRDERPAWRCYF